MKLWMITVVGATLGVFGNVSANDDIYLCQAENNGQNITVVIPDGGVEAKVVMDDETMFWQEAEGYSNPVIRIGPNFFDRYYMFDSTDGKLYTARVRKLRPSGMSFLMSTGAEFWRGTCSYQEKIWVPF